MEYELAHAVRGRLRVRYPTAWLSVRREALTSRLRSVPGVRAVGASALTGSVAIQYDPFRLAEAALLDALGEATSTLEGGESAQLVKGARRPRVTVCRAPLVNFVGATSVLAATALPLPGAAIAALVLASEAPALLRGAEALRQRRLNGDVLEAVTRLLLTLQRHYPAAALLGWLRALGELVVATSVTTTRRSLRDLVAAANRSVERVIDGARTRVSAAEVAVGDVIVIGAGQLVPVDGVIVAGEALVNQQTLTGEPLAVERVPTDRVFAATVVEQGEIKVRVTEVGLDTVVGRIVGAMAAAADEKSDIQLFAERLADRDVGQTFGLAALGAVVSKSLDGGSAILVADYGTAARVGIPTAMLASIRRASRAGILIKGPNALENLARVDTVVFDKTGTLTTGTPRVSRIRSYSRSLAERDVLRLAAAAELGLHHPVARAIARVAGEKRLVVPPAVATSERVGLGVEARVEHARVLVGGRRFLESREVLLGAAAADEAAAHARGASVVLVAIDNRLAGLLVLEDELREDAPDAVLALRARQMRNVILLSGDQAEPARVIAESLGLRHHYAELLPEDKARLIRELKSEGRVVAMVGDGVNDALALREAHVGIAVPGGAELAAEAADVVLLRGGLDRVVRALDLAREAIGGVRRTLGIAARANLAVVGLASLGVARPLLTILLSHGVTVATAVITATRPPTESREPPP